MGSFEAILMKMPKWRALPKLTIKKHPSLSHKTLITRENGKHGASGHFFSRKECGKFGMM